MFLVYDNASNNVLSEYETFAEAEQRRIRIIGQNPMLADVVVVVDLDETEAAYDRAVEAREAQPA